MSWKTSIMGIVAVLSGLGMFGRIISEFAAGRPVGVDEVSVAIATIGSGLGLIAARDNDVTSRDAGAE